MKKLSEKARLYARTYEESPIGREVEGTVELLLQMADKLEEYEKLDEQGKLMKLPCAVGDKLYEPRPDRGMISEYAVNYIGYYGKNHEFFIGWDLVSGIYSNLNGIHVSEIGKTVFLNREEAEAVF